ncbi:hypothetical protein MBLNU13_g04226t2 [Cladosporium sp. NU13]
MSLIKRNVEELEGTINIDIEETLGSTAVVKLPLGRLTDGIKQQPDNDPEGRGGTAIIPPPPDLPEEEPPTLGACVYAPSYRMRRSDKRDKRSVDLLRQSLAHTLGAWFQLPDLVFVTQHDVEIFRQASSEKFKNVKTVVICADIGKYSELDSDKIKAAAVIADAIITGSVIPSKLWKTLSLLFPHIVPINANTIAQFLDDLSMQGQYDEGRADEETNTTSQEQHVTIPAQVESHDCAEADSEDARSSEKCGHQERTPSELAPRPRVLLVDENAVNIKVLSMFLKKNDISMARQTSASGMQEAIDAFKGAFKNDDTFNIIFMDLSMHEVSGLDATAAIRSMEDSSTTGKRAYIVALTGLVSDSATKIAPLLRL